jgi:hypothetical protein
VFRVKVRWPVIIIIHLNRDSVELANLRHSFLDEFSRCSLFYITKYTISLTRGSDNTVFVLNPALARGDDAGSLPSTKIPLAPSHWRQGKQGAEPFSVCFFMKQVACRAYRCDGKNRMKLPRNFRKTSPDLVHLSFLSVPELWRTRRRSDSGVANWCREHRYERLRISFCT